MFVDAKLPVVIRSTTNRKGGYDNRQLHIHFDVEANGVTKPYCANTRILMDQPPSADLVFAFHWFGRNFHFQQASSPVFFPQNPQVHLQLVPLETEEGEFNGKDWFKHFEAVSALTEDQNKWTISDESEPAGQEQSEISSSLQAPNGRKSYTQ